jgi:HD-like signal output (HDOD) protein
MSDEKFKARISTGEQGWKEIIALVGDLPPMPAVAARAVQLVEDPTITAEKLTDVLANDAALTARILKIANSAMFARQREITTLTQAIMTIGFKSLKGIIIAAAVRQINKSSSPFQKLVWENSVGSAMGATMLATAMKKRYREEVYILGLLHALGQIVFLNSKKTMDKYQEVFTTVSEENITFLQAETDKFGYGHPLLGALIAKKWNFSEETCDVIMHYTDPIKGKTPESEMYEKIAIVKLADLLTRSAEIGFIQGYPVDQDEIYELMDHLGLTEGAEKEAKFEELRNQLKEKYEFDAHVYQ